MKEKLVVLLVLLVAGGAAYNVYLYQENRAFVTEINRTEAYLRESAALEKFSERFIEGLAKTAAQTNDSEITQILADNGVSFTIEQPDEATEGDSSPAGESDEEPASE